MKKTFKIFLLFAILLVTLTGCWEEEEEEKKLPKQGESTLTLTCTMTDKDEIEHTIELYIENDTLISKTEYTKWDGKDETTCAFYKKRVEVYNSIDGIKDQVECDNVKGERKTVIVFEDLDTTLAKIFETKYVREDTTYDVKAYRAYRKEEGYNCSVKNELE